MHYKMICSPASTYSHCRQENEEIKDYSSPSPTEKSNHEPRQSSCDIQSACTPRKPQLFENENEDIDTHSERRAENNGITTIICPEQVDVAIVQALQDSPKSTPGATFDAILVEDSCLFLMDPQISSLDTLNRSFSTKKEEILTPYNTNLIPTSSEDSCFWINQLDHSFAISECPSPIGLSPTSFLNVLQDEYLELDELRTPELGSIGPFSPAPNDIWLDNASCFAELASAEEGVNSVTAQAVEPVKMAPETEANEFDYVLGGIGGEVPLIQ